VLHNGKEIRSCITPVAAVAAGTVTTLEGLPALWQGKGRTQSKTETKLHPVQQAWIDEQVPQCGYCQNGMMIRATELLNRVKRPTEAQIKSHMNTHLCRCGTYPRVTKAIKRASATMAKGA
jgi:aerobic-type carbon monoxide dehydrogenase small subunit (CoxS/CutS family)